jgi:hypothetical protein
MPHPEVDFPAFAKALSALNDKEPIVWNPATGRLTKWIDMKKLTAIYGGSGGGKGESKNKGTDLGAACCTIA